MLDGSFDIAPAIRDLAIELDVPRRRVRLLEDAVAALQAADVKPAGSTETSASSTRLSSPKSVEPLVEVGRRGGKRERTAAAAAAEPSVVIDDAVDAG